ncbi:MAG: universal stress protein [Nitrososphaera sp.]|jgi:nucleotide-binding universal stress UspA family protein
MSSTSTSDINLRQIIVPLDGSESSFQAARYAIKIAKMAKAEIIFMHAVVKPPYIEFKGAGIALMHYIEEIKKYAETWYKSVGEIASKEGVKFSTDTILDVVSAPDAIVNYAQDKKADLIVIGTKGRSGIKRVLLGSVASGVVSHAKCPVLVVR